MLVIHPPRWRRRCRCAGWTRQRPARRGSAWGRSTSCWRSSGSGGRRFHHSRFDEEQGRYQRSTISDKGGEMLMRLAVGSLQSSREACRIAAPSRPCCRRRRPLLLASPSPHSRCRPAQQQAALPIVSQKSRRVPQKPHGVAAGALLPCPSPLVLARPCGGFRRGQGWLSVTAVRITNAGIEEVPRGSLTLGRQGA